MTGRAGRIDRDTAPEPNTSAGIDRGARSDQQHAALRRPGVSAATRGPQQAQDRRQRQKAPGTRGGGKVEHERSAEPHDPASATNRARPLAAATAREGCCASSICPSGLGRCGVSVCTAARSQQRQTRRERRYWARSALGADTSEKGGGTQRTPAEKSFTRRRAAAAGAHKRQEQLVMSPRKRSRSSRAARRPGVDGLVVWSAHRAAGCRVQGQKIVSAPAACPGVEGSSSSHKRGAWETSGPAQT